ncbi:hypothetical protein FRC17_007495 [Serendipita sp. 399]|nr:hypothetical protein FRC17_007495 [Serendipita sp. 399]
MLWLLVSQVILGPLVIQAAVVLTNYTVDDSNSTIVYSGNWYRWESPEAYGGGYLYAIGEQSQAVFVFTGMNSFFSAYYQLAHRDEGVSVEFLSPLWPHTDSYVSLDDGPPVLVDLATTENTTQSWDVRWSAEDLENTTHTLVITRGPSGYAISDGFRFTVPIANVTVSSDNGTSTIPFTVPPPTTPSSAVGGTDSASQRTALLIGLLIPVGFAFIVFVFVVIRRRRRSKEQTNLPISGHDVSADPTPTKNGIEKEVVVPNAVFSPSSDGEDKVGSEEVVLDPLPAPAHVYRTADATPFIPPYSTSSSAPNDAGLERHPYNASH